MPESYFAVLWKQETLFAEEICTSQQNSSPIPL